MDLGTVSDEELKRHLLIEYQNARFTVPGFFNAAEYRWVMHPSWLLRIYQMEGIRSYFSPAFAGSGEPDMITGVRVAISLRAGEPALLERHPEPRFEFARVAP